MSEEETIEEVTDESTLSVDDEGAEEILTLSASKLQLLVKGMVEDLLDTMQEVAPEVPEEEEQVETELSAEEDEPSDDKTLAERLEELEEENEKLQKELSGLKEIQKRKGQIQIESDLLPHEVVEEMDEDEDEPDLIRDALKKHLSRPSRVAMIRPRS